MKYTDNPFLLFRHVLNGWAGMHRLRIFPPKTLDDLLRNARAEGAAEAIEAVNREFTDLFKKQLKTAQRKKMVMDWCRGFLTRLRSEG